MGGVGPAAGRKKHGWGALRAVSTIGALLQHTPFIGLPHRASGRFVIHLQPLHGALFPGVGDVKPLSLHCITEVLQGEQHQEGRSSSKGAVHNRACRSRASGIPTRSLSSATRGGVLGTGRELSSPAGNFPSKGGCEMGPMYPWRTISATGLLSACVDVAHTLWAGSKPRKLSCRIAMRAGPGSVSSVAHRLLDQSYTHSPAPRALKPVALCIPSPRARRTTGHTSNSYFFLPGTAESRVPWQVV